MPILQNTGCRVFSAVCFGLGNGVSIVPCTRSDILGSGVYQQEKLVAPAESKSRKALVESYIAHGRE